MIKRGLIEYAYKKYIDSNYHCGINLLKGFSISL